LDFSKGVKQKNSPIEPKVIKGALPCAVFLRLQCLRAVPVPFGKTSAKPLVANQPRSHERKGLRIFHEIQQLKFGALSWEVTSPAVGLGPSGSENCREAKLPTGAQRFL